MRLVAALAASVALLAAGCGSSNPRDPAAAPAAQTTATTGTSGTTGTNRAAQAPNGDIYDWIPHLYDRVSPRIVAVLVDTQQGQGEGSGVI